MAMVQRGERGRLLPGSVLNPNGSRQPTVQQVLDMHGNREEALSLLWDIARKPSNRDQYRAIERICSYYFGTPRINVDVTTDSEPAALMRQLWTAMITGSTDVLDAEGGAVPSAIPPAIDSSQ